jgi:hypothetical protein
MGSLATALHQRRTTKRLYLWAARPKVLFGDDVYDRTPRKSKKRGLIFPALKTPRLYG